MRRILLGLVAIVGTMSAVYVGSTGAFFSDTETSSGNTFAAGAIDLKVDNESFYNGVATSTTSWDLVDLTIEKFFNFFDLKPADYGEDTISLHVDTNDAYMCAEVTLTSNDDNGLNEPESQVDQSDGPGNGELADLVNFVWWADDGDNVLETGETILPGGPLGALDIGATTTVPLADSAGNIWTGVPGPVPGNQTLYVGKAWCFGNIGTAPLAPAAYPSGPAGDNDGVNGPGQPEDGGITCDGGSLGNETQTDSLTANISFTAVQARNNADFVCVPPPPPPTFGACDLPTLAFADNVVTSSQGVRKNGTPVLANRSVTASVLGAPQSSGLPSDPAVPAGSFYSLGFKNNGASDGGSIVVEFTNNVIVDGPGNDLQVWEVTGGVYPDEFVKVEVSQDGVTWFTAANNLSRDAQADLAGSGLAWAKYVRLTDVTPIGPFEPEADAYDLDAFSALNCGVPLQ